MNARNKVFILLGVLFVIALVFYLATTPRGSDLDLIGTVDANQVVVSPQVGGRIAKLVVTSQGWVYVAVASGGSGAGVYLSTDQGKTWTNTLSPATMFLDAGGNVTSGTALASVLGSEFLVLPALFLLSELTLLLATLSRLIFLA